MRKILLSLLLATTVAAPALAERPDRSERTSARQDSSESRSGRSEARQNRSEARQERSQAREERVQVRQDRVEARQQRIEAPQQAMQARPERMQRSESPVREVVRKRSGTPVREEVRQRVVRDERPVMPAANVNERGRPTLEQRQDVRRNAGNWRPGERDTAQQNIERRVERNRLRVPVGARPDRPAPRPETANNRTRHPQWHTDWRRDHRYDWRNYRHKHRSIFRLGIYFDPFGWNYRRYNIGWRLWPSYYSSNYWLNDPYMYRLPYAPWPYKWVRYYDDALLVNTMTGQVVDVMYDFFW